MEPYIKVQAEVFKAGNRRFFTKNAAEKHAARIAIKAFYRATGEDIPGDEWHELTSWLVEEVVRKGRAPTIDDVDAFYNPKEPPHD